MYDGILVICHAEVFERISMMRYVIQECVKGFQ